MERALFHSARHADSSITRNNFAVINHTCRFDKATWEKNLSTETKETKETDGGDMSLIPLNILLTLV